MSIRGLSSSLLLILTLLRPGYALADDSVNPVVLPDDVYEVYRLPMGTMHHVDSTDKVCYDLEQFKLLLVLDSDLRGSNKTISLLTEEVNHYKIATTALKSVVTESDKQIRVLQLDRERLYERWRTENLAKHKAENKPTFGSSLPWILSGILAATTGVLLLVVVAGSSS